jgi:hypothetical protein
MSTLSTSVSQRFTSSCCSAGSSSLGALRQRPPLCYNQYCTCASLKPCQATDAHWLTVSQTLSLPHVLHLAQPLISFAFLTRWRRYIPSCANFARSLVPRCRFAYTISSTTKVSAASTTMLLLIAGFAAALTLYATHAEIIEVTVGNGALVFDPPFVSAQEGDTINFILYAQTTITAIRDGI